MTAAELGQLNINEPPPPLSTRSVDCFQKLHQIGQGTYGQVYMAKDVSTGQTVALKKIITDNQTEGFPITAIREIKLLSKLHHENVIKLKEVVTSQAQESDEGAAADNNNKYDGNVYLVFEYMDHDLTGLSDRPGLRFTIPQIKCYMKQLLTGLHYCHANDVLHRDLKGANLLLDNNGCLKLADFGLAHSFSNHHKGNLTNRVITLPYRPPELLLGATKYGPAIDIWSAGCIFAELLNGKPIMFGRNEPDQLHKVFELCGSPDEISWPGVSKLPWYTNFKPARPMRRRLREYFRQFDPLALDLLDRMLALDPAKRISAQDALDAEYFRVEPLPCDPKSLPKYESSHEFETKKKRQQQRLNEEISRKQKLPCPPPHARLPPIQRNVQISQEVWNNGNHGPVSQLQRPQPTGPNNIPYGNPPVDSGLQNRFTSGGNLGGGYNPSLGGGAQSGGPYPPHGRPGPYAVGSVPIRSASSSYAAGPPGFSQANQYGGAGRGLNSIAGARNQPYGWQQ